MSLHSSFFFLGQTVGPIGYGFGLHHVGKAPTLFAAAAIMVVLGVICTQVLRPRAPADAPH